MGNVINGKLVMQNKSQRLFYHVIVCVGARFTCTNSNVSDDFFYYVNVCVCGKINLKTKIVFSKQKY